jgi:(S)-2-hydroxyglutarate dehydrogenase
VLDVGVIGGGIIGLATAWQLVRASPPIRVAVFEKEDAVARHQSGRNSGVLHSGLYYRPGSEKARLCRAGRQELLDFCAEHGIAHHVGGKLVVAVDERELSRLDELERRGAANGVALRRLDPDGVRGIEPHAAGLAALEVTDAGLVDFPGVCRALAAQLDVRTDHRVSSRADVPARLVVNCAGLHADTVATALGADLGGLRIVPFRGEYHDLRPAARGLVRGLLYPVPDPALPFLGVHLTRGLDGGVHAGPNAVLALSREGYRWADIDGAEVRSLIRAPGMRRLARHYWRDAVTEVARSRSRRLFLRAARRLVPDLRAGDLVPAIRGVRAQAVAADGTLLDDFEIRMTGDSLHVLNAPSPGATASLAIGRHLAGLITDRLN